MNNFDMPTQLDVINFHNTHDTLCVPKGMTLKQLVEDYDRSNNIIKELEKWLNKNWNKPLTKIYVADVAKKISELKENKQYELD